MGRRIGVWVVLCCVVWVVGDACNTQREWRAPSDGRCNPWQTPPLQRALEQAQLREVMGCLLVVQGESSRAQLSLLSAATGEMLGWDGETFSREKALTFSFPAGAKGAMRFLFFSLTREELLRQRDPAQRAVLARSVERSCENLRPQQALSCAPASTNCWFALEFRPSSAGAGSDFADWLVSAEPSGGASCRLYTRMEPVAQQELPAPPEGEREPVVGPDAGPSDFLRPPDFVPPTEPSGGEIGGPEGRPGEAVPDLVGPEPPLVDKVPEPPTPEVVAEAASGEAVAESSSGCNLPAVSPLSTKGCPSCPALTEPTRIQFGEPSVSTSFSPDANILASAQRAKPGMQLWFRTNNSVAFSGFPVGLNNGVGVLVGQVAFGPKGAYLAAANFDKLWLWPVAQIRANQSNLSGLSPLETVTHCTSCATGGVDVTKVGFNPKGDLLAIALSGVQQSTFKLHEIPKPQVTHTLPLPTKSIVTSFAFSPDNTVIATALFYGTQIPYNIEVQLASLTSMPPKVLCRIPSIFAGKPIYDMAFSPKNDYLAVMNSDGNIFLWQRPIGSTPAFELTDGPKRAFTHFGGRLVWSPDGQRVAAVGQDAASQIQSILKVWDVSKPNLVEARTSVPGNNATYGLDFASDCRSIAVGNNGARPSLKVFSCQ